jgi:hypothetical protein
MRTMPRYTSSDKFSALNPFDEDALVPDLEGYAPPPRFVWSAMVDRRQCVCETMGGDAETSGGRTINTTSCGIGNRVHIRVHIRVH